MLIGAEAFFEIMRAGDINIPGTEIVLRNSVFGFIFTGAICTNSQDKAKDFCGLISQSTNTLEQTLRKFWEVEECLSSKELNYMSLEDNLCELHYQNTHKRDDTGRYIVQMPIKDLHKLGESKHLAEQKLNQLWRRLSKNDTMRSHYIKFMQEYLDMGHMEPVEAEDDQDPEDKSNYPHCYLQHHGVYRPEKSTTPLRVVFNASAPTSTGVSLNDLQMKGQVNEDIFDILVRFRKHHIVFTTDIQKMFRQILVEPSQRNLLRLLWKTSEYQPCKTYRLKTVTYGTTSAPFLATRTILQAAKDESERFPLAAEVLERDSYMDDVVSGVDNVLTAVRLKSELSGLLRSCGMELHKWRSNAVELDESTDVVEHRFTDTDETTKTLGVIWNARTDEFRFQLTSLKGQETNTKRDVLSVIARKDKCVRVCSVKTKRGIFKRPITKLAILPVPVEV
ncbi:uncharacterized protein [Parasteatoda tepidariorum]|uniref:uncharacterized protein n=1 Tax=Parasteatoda tepidariorum TaxID=114398 RepID=UPI001C72383F|nr:uncharacterized protein LOC107453955 [Parasteatoda tepidariorum]